MARRKPGYPDAALDLREKFLVPPGLSAGALAKAMGVPRTRVARIAAESSGITADTHCA